MNYYLSEEGIRATDLFPHELYRLLMKGEPTYDNHPDFRKLVNHPAVLFKCGTFDQNKLTSKYTVAVMAGLMRLEDATIAVDEYEKRGMILLISSLTKVYWGDTTCKINGVLMSAKDVQHLMRKAIIDELLPTL